MTVRIKPELEAGLRSRAQADGVPIDDLVSRAVDSYLRETASAVSRASTRDRSREMKWAAHPDPAYLGKWVVLDGDRVIASGCDGKLVCEEARGKGIGTPFLIFVPRRQEPFVGGSTYTRTLVTNG